MAKRSSLGCKMRKKLSDITNSQSHNEVLLQEENLPEIILRTDEYINRLVKENMELVKLLQEKDKIIELNTAELQNLHEGIHKLQVQNWTLTQSNSQFLAEINLARNKVKVLQHEIMCKNALLKAKDSELQDRMNKELQKPAITVQERKNASNRNMVEAEQLCKKINEDASKPSEPKRRPTVRSKSMGASTVQNAEADKAKNENKRRRLRRQSARFQSQEHEDSENLFEIEDIQLTTPLNSNHQDGPVAALHKPDTLKKEDEQEKGGRKSLRPENCMVHRSSIGRPLRRAVEKVNSYKEVPLNIKLRRSE